MTAHRVVIIGGGFGGLYCAMGLRRAPVEVTLIDRRNFHLFQPLLYQVATGGLSPANIASPLRTILERQKNTRVLLGEVDDFDVSAKAVILKDGDRIPYDSLVVATGSTHHYFGHDAEWEPLAPGLKTIEDATDIRRNVFSAFEKAERETDAKNRERLMTFVVVGGGPTGTEMAGTVAELAHYTLKNEFRAIDPRKARVILVEGQNRVLNGFAPKLSEYAKQALHKLGVETILDSRVDDVQRDHVMVLNDATRQYTRIECCTVIWAAGVKASPLATKLANRVGPTVEVDRAGRIVTWTDCSVPGHPDIFVVGDMAHFKGKDGKPLPGVAPVAMQQGKYVASVLNAKARQQPPPPPFSYWDKGSMATIGRSKAVAEANGFKLTGKIAWLAWLFVHILYLARFENRMLVMFQWFWNYITKNRAARLITNVLSDIPSLRGSQSADSKTAVPSGSV